MKKNKIDFFDVIEDHIDNGEDVVLTCSSNGIYAIIDNSIGNSSTILEYNEHTDKVTKMVLPNAMYKYLKNNFDIQKQF